MTGFTITSVSVNRPMSPRRVWCLDDGVSRHGLVGRPRVRLENTIVKEEGESGP